MYDLEHIIPYHQTGILFPDVYPPQLQVLANLPQLYLRGNHDLLSTPNIAIVGTREPTPCARTFAYHLAFRLAQEGVTIVSGLALGIDTAAHQGALDAKGKGKTIAVLASNLDPRNYWPHENRDLAQRIVDEQGLLVTEYGQGIGNHERLMARNRIQSALSYAVIPIQFGVRSGTKRTVNDALAQGRLLYCMEPDMSENQEKYAGNKDLLHKGLAYRIGPTMIKQNMSDILKYVYLTHANYFA